MLLSFRRLNMPEIEVEGKTVEEAIDDGLTKLGCSRERVEVKILDEGTSGLFGLMGTKPAKVLLMTRESSGGDFAEAQEKIKELIGNTLKLMNISFSGINTSLLAGRITADIKTTESGVIIGKNGQTLEALEHILGLMLNKNREPHIKVNLETQGFRAKQEEKLQAMAQNAADEVKKTGNPYRFEPMSAKDRRIIHVFLQNDPELETFSEGEGMFRKVVLQSKK
jgi:spoIIIJ-associated protein